mgnify:CR=1 FL=1
MGNSNRFKRVLKAGILVLIFLSFPILGRTAFGSPDLNLSNPEAIFKEANSAYQQGDFTKAVGLYQQLYDDGYLSGNLFYNLGNTYVKLGARGRGILFYERAKRLIPQDADLKANLNYALTDVQEGVPNWKQEFLKFLTGLASIEWLAISSSVWFFILTILVILWLLKPGPLKTVEGNLRKWWIGLVIGCVIIFLTCSSLGILTYWDQSRDHAVAVRGEEVRFEPSPSATLYYHLDEGTRVLILEERDHWVMIKRVDGKRGWVNKDCLELI